MTEYMGLRRSKAHDFFLSKKKTQQQSFVAVALSVAGPIPHMPNISVLRHTDVCLGLSVYVFCVFRPEFNPNGGC